MVKLHQKTADNCAGVVTRSQDPRCDIAAGIDKSGESGPKFQAQQKVRIKAFPDHEMVVCGFTCPHEFPDGSKADAALLSFTAFGGGLCWTWRRFEDLEAISEG